MNAFDTENLLIVVKLTDALDVHLEDITASLVHLQNHVTAYNKFIINMPFSLKPDPVTGILTTSDHGCLTNDFIEKIVTLSHQRAAPILNFRFKDIDAKIQNGLVLEQEIRTHIPQFPSKILSKAQEYERIRLSVKTPGPVIS